MTPSAPLVNYDLAQIVLYMFWIFFAGLIFYLHRESKREGYPLQSDGRGGRVVIQGFPAIPDPKTFLRADGSTRQSPPGLGADTRAMNAEPVHHYPGSPIVPLGNPLLAGVGPGSWADRPDRPDMDADNRPRLVPLRAAPGFGVSGHDPDPRGMPVLGADREVGGTVVDLWVDRGEMLFRYIEVQVAGGRQVLLPMNFARVTEREVRVASILGRQFADVPGIRGTEQVTMLEEEKVMAYYGAGTLYATPGRAEPLI